MDEEYTTQLSTQLMTGEEDDGLIYDEDGNVIEPEPDFDERL